MIGARGGFALVVALAATQTGLGACRRGTPASTEATPGAPSPPAARSEHSGVPGSLRLRELDADQRRTICDWTAQQYGGYNTSTPCGDAGQRATRVPKDQESCMSSFARIHCDATVAAAEACTVAAARDVCASVMRPPPECRIDGC
jgi:hypothetical protein